MISLDHADIALAPAPSCADPGTVTVRAGVKRAPRVSGHCLRLRLAARAAIALRLAIAAASPQAAVSGGPPALPGLTTVSPARWDATAVRKVMRTFGFAPVPWQVSHSSIAGMRMRVSVPRAASSREISRL